MDRKKKLENALGSLFGRTSPKTEPEKKGDDSTKQPPVQKDGEKLQTGDLIKSKPAIEKKGHKKVKSSQSPSSPPRVEPEIKTIEVLEKEKPEFQEPVSPAQVKSPSVKPKAGETKAEESEIHGSDSKLSKLPERSTALAVKEEVVEEEKKYLVFVLDNTNYGVDVSFVQTTIKPQPIYLVPGTVDFVKGLINLRGSVVPVVDLRTRFDLPQKEKDKLSRFIVVEVGGLIASLIVDEVQGVETIKTSLIEKPSSLVLDINSKFLSGIARFNNQLILMLNLEETIKAEHTEG